MLGGNKAYFPIFERNPNLAYLDNAATTQMPQLVIDAINHFNSYEKSNIHRGVYDLSNNASRKFEETRNKLATFLGSENPDTIAFTSGTTESINIVARSFLHSRLEKNDNIVITLLEHHSNLIPWQMLARKKNAELRVVSIDDNGDLDMGELERLLTAETKLLSLNHISNTLGTINDIEWIIDLAHKKDIPVLIDAAQSALYYDLDISKLNYDFLAFSGHKIFGPFGIGVLYAAEIHHPMMKPYNYGGGIITDVTMDETSFNKYPLNQDAGTPNVSGAVGLSKAIDFINTFDKSEIQGHLQELTSYCLTKLRSIDKVKIIGNPVKRSGIISFTINGIHPHDVASFLNKDQIAVRAGFHCTQPLLAALGVPSTVRVSFSLYNEKEEIDRLQDSLVDLIKFWS